MAGEIQSLIEGTKALRLEHRQHRRYIEAAACHIRETALREALAIVQGKPRPPLTYQPNEYR